VEFQVLSQQAVEPMFDGQILVLLTPSEYPQPPPKVLRYARSAGLHYAVTTGTLQLMPLGNQGNLRMPDFAKFSYINLGNTHRWFPFDNGIFDFHFSLDPLVTPGYIRIVSRVPGFLLNCPTQAHRNPDGSIDVTFKLARSPLVRLVCVVLFFAVAIFGVTMFGLKSYESLATAVASYFFSLWSIRHIVSSEVHVFPTLLDMFILTVSTLVLSGLVWRVLRREEPS
jgi:hypothetical protein